MKAAGLQGSTALLVSKTAHQPIPTPGILCLQHGAKSLKDASTYLLQFSWVPTYLDPSQLHTYLQGIYSLPCSVCTLLCLFLVDMLGDHHFAMGWLFSSPQKDL